MHVNFIKCSLCILCYDHVVYLLYVVNIVDYMNWFYVQVHEGYCFEFFFFLYCLLSVFRY